MDGVGGFLLVQGGNQTKCVTGAADRGEKNLVWPRARIIGSTKSACLETHWGRASCYGMWVWLQNARD